MNPRALVPPCLASMLLAAPAVAQVPGSCDVSAHEPGARPGRLFGDAVSVAGGLAVVLAPGFYTANGPGVAYVYDTRSFGDPLAFLEPSDAAAGHGLGGGVAIDGGTVVAGSRFDSPGGVPSGSAYVFEARGTQWVEVAKLVPSLAPGEGVVNFGITVAIEGDVLVVGAPSGSPATPQGRVFVFERGDGGWVQTAVLRGGPQGFTDHFGWSVSIDGGVIAVGAEQDSELAINSGAVYVFERGRGGAWTETAKLKRALAGGSDFLGASVAISGDTIVAGAWNDSSPAAQQGSATVFQELGGQWTETQLLTASDGGAGEDFGWSVAVQGETLLVGANDARNALGVPSGAVYAFQRPRDGTVWCEVAKLTHPLGGAGDRFGRSCSMSRQSVLVGARENAEHGTYAGAAYLFSRECLAIGTARPVRSPERSPAGAR